METENGNGKTESRGIVNSIRVAGHEIRKGHCSMLECRVYSKKFDRCLTDNADRETKNAVFLTEDAIIDFLNTATSLDIRENVAFLSEGNYHVVRMNNSAWEVIALIPNKNKVV